MNTTIRKSFTILAITLIAVISAGYWYFFREQVFPLVESAFVMPVEEHGALSPDGSFIYTSTHTKVDVQDGLQTYNGFDFRFDIYPAWSIMDLSPNGRYLTAQTGSMGNYYKYLLDITEKTYREESHMCNSWSGDSTRCLEFFQFELVEMPENKVVEEWSRNEDFRNLRNVSGDYIFLWDMDKRIPVAEIYPCDDEGNNTSSTQCIVSLSYDEGRFPLHKDREHATIAPILEIEPPQEVVSYIFDPTGRFVLFAIWEHYGEYVSGKYDTSTVTDTVLVLVDWRTKKSTELFRLSSIDSSNIAVGRGSSALQWSSDGSTIFIARNYAPAIVLKIKYP